MKMGRGEAVTHTCGGSRDDLITAHKNSSGLRFRDWGDVVMGYEIKSGFGMVLRLWAFGYCAIPAAKLDPVN